MRHAHRAPFPMVVLAMAFVSLFCPSRVHAQMDASPPDGVTIVGSHTRVPFRWNGTGKVYQVDILSVRGTLVKTETVQGNWVSITLPNTGVDYLWRLREGTSQKSLVERRFRLTSDLVYKFDGAAGAQGQSGGDGQAVRVEFRPFADYYGVSIGPAGPPIRFLMLRDSSPLTISSRGGDGGRGLQGMPGQTGWVRSDGYVMPGGNGGAGGPGGNGGRGGTITVVTNGLELRRLLVTRLEGGAAGPGGPGGIGGVSSYGGVSGMEGPPGPAGTNGPNGEVIWQ